MLHKKTKISELSLVLRKVGTFDRSANSRGRYEVGDCLAAVPVCDAGGTYAMASN
jgi:hypothetical protein